MENKIENYLHTMTRGHILDLDYVIVNAQEFYKIIEESKCWNIESSEMKFFTDPENNLYYKNIPDIRGFRIPSASLLRWFDFNGESHNANLDYCGLSDTKPLIKGIPIPITINIINIELLIS